MYFFDFQSVIKKSPKINLGLGVARSGVEPETSGL